MQNNEHALQEAIRIAQSTEGKQLRSLLQNCDPSKLRQVMNLAGNGDYTGAQEILKSLMNQPDIQNILRQIGDNHG